MKTKLTLLCALLSAALFAPLRGQPDREQALRCAKTLQRLARDPYPAEGPWHDVAQSISAYWTGDRSTGDSAILDLSRQRQEARAKAEKADEDSGFHWQVYQIARIVLLFGQHGSRVAGSMSPAAEAAAKQMIWQWMAPRARTVLVDPTKDWWIWGSENHHLQAWFSLWTTLRLLAADPAYAERTFADGATVRQLKPAFDDYFKRWIRNRATRGLWVETGAQTYAKYSLPGFYNLVDFSDDAELRRLAREFLDLCWAQWAVEQIDGMRAGSRHRSYHGSSSITDGALSDLAWYHFGLGAKDSVQPSVLCTLTSSYEPTALVREIAARRAELGSYQITSRQPGRADASLPMARNYVADPNYPMYFKVGVYKLDPACPSMLRRTYADPGFILGSTMIPALPPSAWTAISSQNRWDGVCFRGPGAPRIFFQPQNTAKGSLYNTQWSVQQRGVLIAQRLPAQSALPPTVFFSSSLPRTEAGGWIFVEAPEAYAAVKVVAGGWKFEPDRAEYWHSPHQFRNLGEWLVPENLSSAIILEVVPKKLGTGFASFQNTILANRLAVEKDRVDYTSSYYQTTLTFFPVSKLTPWIDGAPVRYEAPACFDGEVLNGRFGGDSVRLSAFDQVHLFRF